MIHRSIHTLHLPAISHSVSSHFDSLSAPDSSTMCTWNEYICHIQLHTYSTPGLGCVCAMGMYWLASIGKIKHQIQHHVNTIHRLKILRQYSSAQPNESSVWWYSACMICLRMQIDSDNNNKTFLEFQFISLEVKLSTQTQIRNRSSSLPLSVSVLAVFLHLLAAAAAVFPLFAFVFHSVSVVFFIFCFVSLARFSFFSR